MDRRRFLKLAALTGAGFSVSDGIARLAGAAEPAARPDLVVVQGASPEQARPVGDRRDRGASGSSSPAGTSW